MKQIKRYLALLLSCIFVLSCITFVSAAESETVQIILEDVTESADTLSGEAKVKISAAGVDGSLTLAQLKFIFDGDGTYKSIAYSDEITNLRNASGSGQPFYVQPIDAKKANSTKSFDFAFSGGAKHSLPVSSEGTELCTVTFEGNPGEEVTISLTDLEDSYCVVSPNLISPKVHVQDTVSQTLKFNSTTNTGVSVTVLAELDELKESGGLKDSSDIKLTFTNTSNGQVRTVSFSDGEKTDAASYTFVINKLLAGNYDISISGDGFVSKKKSNIALTTDKEVMFTSEDFYAGDVNTDSRLTIRDYNRFVSLLEKNAAVFSGVDYNRDGAFSNYDLLAMVNSAKNHMEADSKGSTDATLTAKASETSVKKGDTFTVTLTLDAGEHEVNSYYIKGTYPSDLAEPETAECIETSADNKAINICESGKFEFLNKVSDGAKKEIYKLTFKAKKAGTFKLSFDNAEGALFYDVENDSDDKLLNIKTSSESVSLTAKDSGGTGGTGGTGGGNSGGNSGGNTGGNTGGNNGNNGNNGGNTTGKHMPFVSGYEDHTIRPDNSITRAEAAAMIARICDDFSEQAAYDASRFSDVTASDWYAKYVGYAAEKNIVSGYEDGTFAPNANITREEFAAMICRFMGYELIENESFADVPTGHWARKYIDPLKAHGILSGYEDGTFGIERQIVRGEVIVMINRALGRVPNDEKVQGYVSEYGYPALDIEGHWAASNIIEAMVEHNMNILH